MKEKMDRVKEFLTWKKRHLENWENFREVEIKRERDTQTRIHTYIHTYIERHQWLCDHKTLDDFEEVFLIFGRKILIQEGRERKKRDSWEPKKLRNPS